MSTSRLFLTSISAKKFRILLNVWAPYLGTGVRVTHLSEDWREIDVSMKLRWYNKNPLGSHFGGGLYAMVDPFYMIMLMRNIGRDHLVVDRSAVIEYIKPGKTKVFAKFRLSDNDIHDIVSRASDGQPHHMQFDVDVVDTSGEVVTKIRKTLYIRLKKARPQTHTSN